MRERQVSGSGQTAGYDLDEARSGNNALNILLSA